MPRSSSSSGARSYSTHSKVSKVIPAAPAPAPFHATPPTLSVERPTLGQSMKEGFGVGIGMSVARNLVDRWFAPSVPPSTPNPVPIMESSSSSKTLGGCNRELQALNACLATEKGDGVCSDVLRSYSQCQEMMQPPR